MRVSAILLTDSLKVVIDKKTYNVAKSDSRLKDILLTLEAISDIPLDDDVRDQAIADLESKLAPVRHFVENSNGQFEIADNQLYHVDFKDIPVPSELANTIVNYCTNGYPIRALANFWKKLAKNPNPNSRNQFYKWLEKNEITIDSDGDAMLYKAVRKYNQHGKQVRQIVNFGEQGWKVDTQGVIVDKDGNLVLEVSVKSDVCDVEYIDIHSGTFNNTPGMVVKMDRKLCDPNSSVHCSTGLHCSNVRYARSFGSTGDTIVIVKVNPEHVVSVPHDGFEKIRCCEYTVLAVFEEIGEYKEELPGYVNTRMGSDFDFDQAEENDEWEEDDHLYENDYMEDSFKKLRDEENESWKDLIGDEQGAVEMADAITAGQSDAALFIHNDILNQKEEKAVTKTVLSACVAGQTYSVGDLVSVDLGGFEHKNLYPIQALDISTGNVYCLLNNDTGLPVWLNVIDVLNPRKY